jgi:hypothetical protein
MQNLQESKLDFEILYTDMSSKNEQILIEIYVRETKKKKKKKDHCVTFNVKIYIFLYEEKACTVKRRQMRMNKERSRTYL